MPTDDTEIVIHEPGTGEKDRAIREQSFLARRFARRHRENIELAKREFPAFAELIETLKRLFGSATATAPAVVDLDFEGISSRLGLRELPEPVRMLCLEQYHCVIDLICNRSGVGLVAIPWDDAGKPVAVSLDDAKHSLGFPTVFRPCNSQIGHESPCNTLQTLPNSSDLNCASTNATLNSCSNKVFQLEHNERIGPPMFPANMQITVHLDFTSLGPVLEAILAKLQAMDRPAAPVARPVGKSPDLAAPFTPETALPAGVDPYAALSAEPAPAPAEEAKPRKSRGPYKPRATATAAEAPAPAPEPTPAPIAAAPAAPAVPSAPATPPPAAPSPVGAFERTILEFFNVAKKVHTETKGAKGFESAAAATGFLLSTLGVKQIRDAKTDEANSVAKLRAAIAELQGA